MKGELVKRVYRWDLYDADGHKIASTLDGAGYKLSIKNCQSITSGYDSLQQTEWDVEIEMDFMEEEQTGTDLIWGRFTPKLDTDGFLILKLKSITQQTLIGNCL